MNNKKQMFAEQRAAGEKFRAACEAHLSGEMNTFDFLNEMISYAHIVGTIERKDNALEKFLERMTRFYAVATLSDLKGGNSVYAGFCSADALYEITMDNLTEDLK